MPWIQRTIELNERARGFHLVTREVVAALPELAQFDVGLLHVFIQHTSASLTINENADPDVPADLEASFAAIAPEDFPYRHTCEGPDDMPAHVKASLLGASVTIPIARRTRPGHLAGHLPLRTPPPRRPPPAGADAIRRRCRNATGLAQITCSVQADSCQATPDNQG